MNSFTHIHDKFTKGIGEIDDRNEWWKRRKSMLAVWLNDIYIYISAQSVECLPMVREIGIQSQVKSYQRH